MQSLHRGRSSHPYWWPTAGTISRRFGDAVRGLSEAGIGIAAPGGTEVCAVAAGTVICCVRAPPGSQRGWGNVVAIRHSSGLVSWYAQLGQVAVKEWQKVAKGERIGTVGSSGDSPHRLNGCERILPHRIASLVYAAAMRGFRSEGEPRVLPTSRNRRR